jgi:hypothetical protein
MKCLNERCVFRKHGISQKVWICKHTQRILSNHSTALFFPNLSHYTIEHPYRTTTILEYGI